MWFVSFWAESVYSLLTGRQPNHMEESANSLHLRDLFY